jgi:peptidoglycan-associated lipoprotein
MRAKFLIQVVVVLCVAVVALTGCKNPPWKKKTAQPGGETSVPPLGAGGDVAAGERPIITGEGQMKHGQFAPVLFDYDSARIRPTEVSKLEAVAAYFRTNPGKLLIEGHCDERGTAEYNRALGERRALAAREELVKMGVDAGRISTISYGKDRPVDLGHDETAWAKNRRCEFVIIAP